MVANLAGGEHFPREARSHPMTPILDLSPTWILLAVLVVFLITATSASRRLARRNLGRWDVKVCDRCGTSQPPHAAYCRQCGTRLP